MTRTAARAAYNRAHRQELKLRSQEYNRAHRQELKLRSRQMLQSFKDQHEKIAIKMTAATSRRAASSIAEGAADTKASSWLLVKNGKSN